MTTTATQIKSLPDLYKFRSLETPDAYAHFIMQKNGIHEKTTWQSFYKTAGQYASWLQAIGFKNGDNIGIMLNTSQIWEYVQLASLMSGCVVVGIDPADTEENINFVIKKAGLSSIFVQSSNRLKKIDSDLKQKMKCVIAVEDDPVLPNGYKLNKNKTATINPATLPKANDPATIIFTSGTTGLPKGILYTHHQIIVACQSILDRFDDIDNKANIACWLPLSNLFQRIINFCAVHVGAGIYFIENPKLIVELLPKINPQFFIGVPRVFEKIYSAIEYQIETQPVFKKRLVRAALFYGEKKAAMARANQSLPIFDLFIYKIFDFFVLKRIRTMFGSQIKYFISGSAPMPEWLLKRFHALGILVLEAYGISENIIPNAMNSPSDYTFGTVGKPLKENTFKFLPDNELLVKGPGVFNGYYGQSIHDSHFTEDGFFPTGDFVKQDDNGNLIITGRKSEVFKTTTGRKISPSAIESCLGQTSYVEQGVVFGRNKKYPIALLILKENFFNDKISAVFQYKTFKDLIEEPPKTVLENLAEDLVEKTKNLPRYFHPAAFYLTTYQLSVERNELTSNLKLKRSYIEQEFNKVIASIYAKLEDKKGNNFDLFSYESSAGLYLMIDASSFKDLQ